jgi:hypothetical protein
MKKVKITKLGSVDNPIYPTPNFNEYTPGEDNGNVSLPVEYWLEGYFMNEPVVGSSVLVNRTSRNGVTCGGSFFTSKVTKITDTGFETQNSVYQVDILENEKID